MSTASDKRIVLVVPTYNECENLPLLFERIAALRDQRITALIVDDASPDGTGKLAESLRARYAFVSVLHRERKEGLGRAYAAGFAWAFEHDADVIMQMDADGSHDVSEIPAMLSLLEKTQSDVVIGSRRVPGGSVRNWEWYRRAMSWCAMAVARFVLRLRTQDVTSGFRVWRGAALRTLFQDVMKSAVSITFSSGYAFQEELVYHAERLGFRITEYPITFRDRTRGFSKLGVRDVAGFFRALPRLVFQIHDRRFTFWLAMSLVVLTGFPYLLGWFWTPPGHVFTGIHTIAPGDMSVYGSYIEQVRDGRFLFIDLFTSEWPQQERLDIFWLAAGLFAKATHLSAPVAFHVLRLLLIIPFVFFLARFVRFCIPRPIANFPLRTIHRTTLLFLSYSSGIGAYLAPLLAPYAFSFSGYVHWPMDLWVAESNTFLAIYQTPHFIASLWLLLLVFYWTLRYLQHADVAQSARWYFPHRLSVFSGLAALVLFQFHPFYVPTVVAVLIAWTAIEILVAREMQWAMVKHGVIVFLMSAPPIIYYLWLLWADPILAMEAQQNFLFTPAWWIVLVSYGFLVPLAFGGAIKLIRERSREARFLLVWLATTIILIFSPLPWQRRLTEGLHIAIVLVAMVGLFSFLTWLPRHLPYGIRRYVWWSLTTWMMWVVLFTFSTLVDVVRDILFFSVSRFPQKEEQHYVYHSLFSLDAMHWIRVHTEEGDATFAAELDGNMFPMYAGRISAVGHSVATTQFIQKRATGLKFAGGLLSQEEARAFLDRLRIRYILVTDVSRDVWTITPDSIPGVRRVYANEGAEVYEVQR